MTSLSSSLSVFSLAALVLSCGAVRIRKQIGQEVEQRISAFDDECPKNVEINTKGDCISAEGRLVAYRCCDHIRNCDGKVREVFEHYNERLNFYMSKCEINRGDLKQSGQDFVVIDDTHVCSGSCQGFQFLQEPSRSLDSWEISVKCKREALYQNVLVRHCAVVKCLDDAWANCNTTAAPETTMLPSITTTAALGTTMLPSTSPGLGQDPAQPNATSPNPEKCCCGKNPGNRWPDYRKLYPNKAGWYPDYNVYYPNPSHLYPDYDGRYPDKAGWYPDYNGYYPSPSHLYPDYNGMYPDSQPQGRYPAELDMPIDCGYDACGNILPCDSSGKQA